MAFSDPMVLTLDGVAKNLVRVDSFKYGAEYALAEATQAFSLFIRTQPALRKDKLTGRLVVRHNLTLRWTVFATATAPELIRQASYSIDHYVGDDVTKFDDPAIALAGLMTAPNIVKLNNGEG